MSAASIMTIGTIAFGQGVDLQGYTRSDSWRHLFTEVQSGGSGHQYAGDDATELHLEGVVFPGQRGDADAAEQLRELARTGEKHSVIRGDGTFLGDYFIVNVSEDNRVLLQSGQGRQVSYSLRLRKDDRVTG